MSTQRLRNEKSSSALRFLIPLAILLTFAGCQDLSAPADNGTIDAPQFSSVGVSEWNGADSVPILQQGPDAPALETYHVSFWLHKNNDKPVSVTVNYLPRPGQSVGEPFLWFDVPRGALRTGGGGKRLSGRDSVLITLSIDPVDFTIDFEPSGVKFAKRNSPRLALWYENANHDLNGDGVVDATDNELLKQLRIVWRQNRRGRWHRLPRSLKDSTFPFVFGNINHFSQYSVSW